MRGRDARARAISVLRRLAYDSPYTICALRGTSRLPKIEKISIDKATFDKMHAADRMATDKLKEGIEGFSKSLEGLEELLAKHVSELKQPVTA